MRELTQVRDAVVSALQEAGLAAEAAFPHRPLPRCREALAAVAVGAAAGMALGFCDYLGEVWDDQAGTVREIYGKQLEGEIAVEIRAEQAAVCEDGCAVASEVLLERLPDGIWPGELRWEAVRWEKETGMFLRRGTLQCRALFLAQEQAEDGAFLDFILKGAMEQ